MEWRYCREDKPHVIVWGEVEDGVPESSETVLLAWEELIDKDAFTSEYYTVYATGYYVPHEGWWAFALDKGGEPTPCNPVFWLELPNPFHSHISYEVDYFKGKKPADKKK